MLGVEMRREIMSPTAIYGQILHRILHKHNRACQGRKKASCLDVYTKV